MPSRGTPGDLTSEEHRDLTTQFLYYLTHTDQVELVAMDKDDFYRTYSGGPPAMVFLDAIHTYRRDRQGHRLGETPGARIVCGHDYSSDWPGVIQAVDELGGARKLRGTVWCL